jgi:hypothetical protein
MRLFRRRPWPERPECIRLVAMYSSLKLHLAYMVQTRELINRMRDPLPGETINGENFEATLSPYLADLETHSRQVSLLLAKQLRAGIVRAAVDLKPGFIDYAEGAYMRYIAAVLDDFADPG